MERVFKTADKTLKHVPGLPFQAKCLSIYLISPSPPAALGAFKWRFCGDSNLIQRYVSNGEIPVGILRGVCIPSSPSI